MSPAASGKPQSRPAGQLTLDDDGTEEVNWNFPPRLSEIELLEEDSPQVESLGGGMGRQRKVRTAKFHDPTHEEGDEAEVGADGDPDRGARVLNEAERQVDDGRAEREDTDRPQVDGEVGKTVETLDVTDTLYA